MALGDLIRKYLQLEGGGDAIDRIHMLKKIVKEADNIVTALHNIDASWIVSGTIAWARLVGNFPRTIAQLLSDHNLAHHGLGTIVPHDALASLTEKAHGSLTGVTSDQHHARDHHTRHEPGGADEVSGVTPGAHAASHQDTGADEINVAGLSGELADDQKPKAHDASKVTSGTFPVARGGTGLSTIALGGILYASALDILSRLAPTAANQVLRSTAANALQFAALLAADIPNLDASKITTGQIPLARLADAVCSETEADGKITTHETGAKHRWTLNKLLKGAGAGADPTLIDVPSGLTFTELAGGESHKVSADDTWEDWDLSAIIGAGAVAALIGIAATDTANSGGARKNGSALSRKFSIRTTAPNYIEAILLTEVDANRVIDIYSNQKLYAYFNVLGYWS